MEIKGEEFIKKVHLQQERDELEQKLNELEEVHSTIGENSTVINENNENDSINNLDDTQLGNIMLEEPKTEDTDNKKKYLILGLILVILFLFTIIIIRLLSNDPSKDSFTSNQNDPIETNITSEDSSIEENFQKIMNERIRNENNENINEINSEEKINEIEDEQEVIENDREEISEDLLDETIKKIEAKEEPQKKIEVKPERKKVIEQTPKQSVQALVKLK